jgi:outer membrane protein TolC
VVAAEALFAAVVGVPERLLDVAAAPPVVAATPSLEDAIARAEQRDPAVAALVAAERQQQAVTHAIGAELRPDLSLTASISGRAGGAAPTSGPIPDGGGWLPDVPNWNAGLVFSWPLYDGVVRARANASRQLERARHAEAEALRQRVVADVQQAYEALRVAEEALPALGRAASAASANYDQADARFKAGLATQLELADAEALRTDAEIGLAVGRFQASSARARLGRAMGERP